MLLWWFCSGTKVAEGTPSGTFYPIASCRGAACLAPRGRARCRILGCQEHLYKNGMMICTIVALKTTKLCLVLLWHSRGGASSRSGVAIRYQVPDPDSIHHVSPHLSGRASRATKKNHRVTKYSKIMLGSLGSATYVVSLATRP